MQTSVPRVGFESTVPVFERAKTVHALDHVGTAIGYVIYVYYLFTCMCTVHLNILWLDMLSVVHSGRPV
jgi:hypothetical protein